VPIELEEYDPNWPSAARAACAELNTALPDVLTPIEHIGSTSVPGLAAKPIIDLLAAADLDAVVAHESVLERLKYRRHETRHAESAFLSP